MGRKEVMMRKIFLITSLLLLPTTLALAAPTISAVLSENGFLTITGTNFGEKAGGTAPIIFDTFDNSHAQSDHYAANPSSGTAVEDEGVWTKRIWGAYFSDTHAYSGTLSVLNDTGNSGQDGFGSVYQHFTPTDEVYFSYRFYHEEISDCEGTGKMPRINCNSDGGTDTDGTSHYNGRGDMGANNFNYGNSNPWSAAPSASPQTNNGDEILDPRDSGYSQRATFGGLAPDKWWFAEYYRKLSTAGQADGIIDYKLNNYDRWYDASIMTRNSGSAWQQNCVLIPTMYSVSSGQMKFYCDDVYLDNTRARVVSGTNETYTSNSNFAHQIPTDTTPDSDGWDDTQIVCHYNQVSSNLTENVFVIDANGLISNGFPIQEGGIGGGAIPPVVNDCTVSGVSVAVWDDGDSIIISGIDFGASGGTVYICDDSAMGGSLSVAQTEVTWSDTSIAITAVQSTFSDGDSGWLLVKDSGNAISNGLEGSWYLEPPADVACTRGIKFEINSVQGVIRFYDDDV